MTNSFPNFWGNAAFSARMMAAMGVLLWLVDTSDMGYLIAVIFLLIVGEVCKVLDQGFKARA